MLPQKTPKQAIDEMLLRMDDDIIAATDQFAYGEVLDQTYHTVRNTTDFLDSAVTDALEEICSKPHLGAPLAAAQFIIRHS